ncbi:hypothetical protein PCASD_24116 [Puccinia coronata f. sp. avenae]|uniref:Uncharacterized protein n=1 Tax=Puccinia coronata f. sp. avenae TaxID=200324 RepID=A0A2N5TNX0_9BASI|nr:hypothetical protein PCASD_24116 [Puccinia coronata f. sp. avenae]
MLFVAAGSTIAAMFFTGILEEKVPALHAAMDTQPTAMEAQLDMPRTAMKAQHA